MRAGLLVFAGLLCLNAAAAERPRLAVLVVVDQLAASTYERLLPRARHGFARLERKGARFLDARYDAVPTMTSVGHATLSTGATPAVHGIIGNEWVDGATGKRIIVCTDARHRTVGREPAPYDGTAPAELRVGTLGESLKLTHPEGKVVALSGKDRATILLAGRAADAALWLDGEKPFFTTSTFYAEALPAWVEPVNQRIEATLRAELVWSAPKNAPRQEPRPFARDLDGYGRVFPHVIRADAPPATKANQLAHHPLAAELLVDLARAAIDALELGSDAAADLLMLSFSSFDEMAHAFGPDALETALAFEGIDLQLGRLLETLDARVGKGRYVVALSADHGGGPVPEVAQRAKLDAGRIDLNGVRAALERVADEQLGAGDWFTGVSQLGLYVRPGALAKLSTLHDVLNAAARAQPGIERLLTRDQVLRADGEVERVFRRGFDAARSPDLFLVTRPHWIPGSRYAASHGSHHLYDRAVPLLLFGAGVRRGAFHGGHPIDVAPTLAALLGIAPPSDAEGRVLTEALAP